MHDYVRNQIDEILILDVDLLQFQFEVLGKAKGRIVFTQRSLHVGVENREIIMSTGSHRHDEGRIHTSACTVAILPEIETIDEAIFPHPGWIEEVAHCRVEVSEMPVPGDCSDGFLCAYWRRPEAYLDPGVRGAISTFARLSEVESRLRRLRGDLESGLWHSRYGDLLEKESMDYGYRVLVLQAEK